MNLLIQTFLHTALEENAGLVESVLKIYTRLESPTAKERIALLSTSINDD